MLISLLLLLVGVQAYAFPELSRLTPTDFPAQGRNYDFEGVVRLSNCSGSFIRLKNSADTDRGLILTNGHCLLTGFPQPNEAVSGVEARRRFHLYTARGTSSAVLFSDTLLYATMTGTDMAIYRLTETYAEITSNYGIRPLELSDVRAEPGRSIDIVSGYWERGYSCAIEALVPVLREGDWVMNNSLRYTRPGCEIIGGTSGSPVIEAGTRVVIGVNNTMNENGLACDRNNPCEIDEQGRVAYAQGWGYAQQTHLLYTCLNANRELDLSVAGCALYH